MMAADTPLGGTIRQPVLRFRNGECEYCDDTLSSEARVHIRWRDSSTRQEGEAALWAWPNDLASLALGHVLLDVCKDGAAFDRKAELTQSSETDFTVTLGEAREAHLPAAPTAVNAQALLAAMHNFIAAEGYWESTGCFHRAGVFDPAQQTLLMRAEDIGRHNCLDRIAGWSAVAGVPLSDKVLLTTARITASLCVKALRAGFRVLVSRSAVTSASLALCEEHGATLLGFVRTGEGRFTVFVDGAGRIASPGQGAL